MDYKAFILKSITIFFLIFIIGYNVNKFFEKVQERNPDISPGLFGFIHLLCIINIAYIIHASEISKHFELYTPNIMFSSFLLSLQTSMISNFKNALNDMI